MGKTNLNVEDFEDKKYGEGKRYTRFKTSQGWISCFDKKTIEALKDAEGEDVSVTIETDKNDREKITKFHGKADGDVDKDSDEEAEDEPTEKRPKKQSSGFSNASMYASYAKDIFVALISKSEKPEIEECMKDSIKLVKQARSAFEESE